MDGTRARFLTGPFGGDQKQFLTGHFGGDQIYLFHGERSRSRFLKPSPFLLPADHAGLALPRASLFSAARGDTVWT